jgi:uncharacterized protein
LVSAATDTLGSSGVFQDPLWRVPVRLTALEQELLRCWWVRRLGFIAHAGAAVITTTQSYSRLEHSLGLLALVAHFDPDDQVARAAALLHDIGHLPFSHTFEGVAGLSHHQLGVDRIQELDGVLRRHEVDAAAVIEVEQGRRPSVLHGAANMLRLDHLESLVRSASAHGRTRQPPPATLARVRIVDGAVDTDADTGRYLLELVAGEALSQSSAANVIAAGVMRHCATQLLTNMSAVRRAEVAAMTDHEFWMLLLTDPLTAATAETLRRDPAQWEVVEDSVNRLDDDGSPVEDGSIRYQLSRFYLDLPLVNGRRPAFSPSALAELPAAPWRCVLRRQDAAARG